jgi:hypothetical protein
VRLLAGVAAGGGTETAGATAGLRLVVRLRRSVIVPSPTPNAIAAATMTVAISSLPSLARAVPDTGLLAARVGAAVGVGAGSGGC